MDLALIAVGGTAVAVFMLVLGIARREATPIVTGVAILGVAAMFAALLMLTQISD